MSHVYEGFPLKKETPWDKFPHGTLIKNEINGKTGVVLPHPNGDQNLMCNTFWVIYRKDSEIMTQEDVDSIVVDPDNYDQNKYQGSLTNPANCESVGVAYLPQMEVFESKDVIEFKPSGTDGQ